MSDMIIRTVTGDIAPGELGLCDNHNHSLIRAEHMRKVAGYMITDDYALFMNELKEFKAAGGNAFVECSTVGQARPTEDLVRISEESGIRIIAATGFHMPAFYPEGHWSLTMNEQELSDIYIAELTKGMYYDCDTTVPEKQIEAKAGIIKAACVNAEFDELDTRRFRAAANASVATGASVHVHTHYANANGLTCAKNLLAMGVAPENIIIAHTDMVGTVPPDEYQIKIAELGVYLDMDSFGNPHPTVNRGFQIGSAMNIIKAVVDAGYGKQVMLGDDMLSYGLKGLGGDGMDFNIRYIYRWLWALGLTEEQLQDIYYNNPTHANSMKKC